MTTIELAEEDAAAAAAIMARYESGGRAAAAIYPDPPPPAKRVGFCGVRLLSAVLQAVVMAAALVLFFVFAGFAVIVLIHLLVVSGAFRRRRASPSSSAAPAPFPAGLSPRDLRRIPSFKYRPPRTSQSAAPLHASGTIPSDCAVCLDGFRDGDRLRVLPACGHTFHTSCVDKWLVRSPACPICRCTVSPSS